MKTAQQLLFKIALSIIIMMICGFVFSILYVGSTFASLLAAGIAFYSIREIWKLDLAKPFNPNADKTQWQDPETSDQ